jgi:predicted adenine nucleotide alpha hydrolase (AANH) superfamily ATPase
MLLWNVHNRFPRHLISIYCKTVFYFFTENISFLKNYYNKSQLVTDSVYEILSFLGHGKDRRKKMQKFSLVSEETMHKLRYAEWDTLANEVKCVLHIVFFISFYNTEISIHRSWELRKEKQTTYVIEILFSYTKQLHSYTFLAGRT